MRKTSYYTTEEDDIFSPGTDLIISLLAILLIVIFIGTKIYKDTQQQLKENKKSIFPPNVIIEGAGQYAFPSGKAELSKELKEFIRNELVDKIEENIEQYDINVIEVIGHTDSQAVSSSSSNLDQILEKVANGYIPITRLSANSNADLGLMRALAVVKELQNIKNQRKCRKKPEQQGCLYKLSAKKGFRVYSAAQLISPDGEFAKLNLGADAKRRRIEIRFTRLRPNANFSK